MIVPGNQELVIRNDHGDYMPKVEDGPWPAFPADLTSIALALATQAEGSVIIHEKMFENRLFFTDKLVMMGAAITICDPHRAIVVGPRRLRGERVESPDIRAGMAMLIAALCAEGTTEIGNIRQIDRGYERIDERLRELGARITRVDDVPATSERCPHERRAASCPSEPPDGRPDSQRNARRPARRDARAARDDRAHSRGVRTGRLRRGLHARARVRGGRFERRAASPARGPPTGCSTSTATCSCCAPT